MKNPAKQYYKTFKIDTKEKNKALLELVKNDDSVTWVHEALYLSTFMIVNADQDSPCFDLTNENGDAGVELKQAGDFVNTFYDNGGYRGEDQCRKMHATGIPSCIIVYGLFFSWIKSTAQILFNSQPDKYQDIKTAEDAAHGMVLSAFQKAIRCCRTWNITLVPALNEKDALEMAKTFIQKSSVLPRRLSTTMYLERESDTPANMHSCTFMIGPEIAKKVVKDKYKSMIEFCLAVHDNPAKVQEDLEKIDGIGPTIAKRIIKGVCMRSDGSVFMKPMDPMDGEDPVIPKRVFKMKGVKK